MESMNFEDWVAQKYGYYPLPKDLSKEYRQLYKDNLPKWAEIDGSNDWLYTKKKSLICNGYNRIVIGDYGAYIEFTPEQANKDIFMVKAGEEYRVNDPKYKNVKYHWYTINDGSDIKIYYQRRKVAYADYIRGMYYISSHEVTKY